MNDAKPRPATLDDVAREAGVSLATASRSLNGSNRKVAESYRQKVLQAAERLRYTPNLPAQAVARGGSATVSLLVSDIADPYFSSIAAGVARSAGQANLIMTMGMTDRRPEREVQLVRALRGQRPQVIIIAGSRVLDADETPALIEELSAYEEAGGHAVFIGRHDLPFRSVSIDNRGGSKRLAVALADIGYRRFALVMGPSALLTVRDREEGFLEGLTERGINLDPRLLLRRDFTRDGGAHAARELIAGPIQDVDMIFAASDVMAVGAMAELRAGGVRVPDHVGVAGFDDIPNLRDITPSLSTVHLPLEEIGQRAVQLAFAPTDAITSPPPVTADVVLRDSTPGRR
jgi:LacI family transcriptional regulator